MDDGLDAGLLRELREAIESLPAAVDGGPVAALFHVPVAELDQLDTRLGAGLEQ